jgi:drug/metabolite transporter (DMT)-like permease
MSSVWILLALASTAIAALVNTFDSHFLSRRMPGLRSYLLIIGLFTILVSFVLLLIFPFPRDTAPSIYAMATACAALRVGAVMTLMYAMKKEDVSRIMPLEATAPIFVAIMASVFLGESLRAVQLAAIAIVVLGAVLISFKRSDGGSSRFHAASFSLLMCSSLLYAASDVINKYTLDYISYWNSASLNFLLTSVFFVIICLRRDVIRQIKNVTKPWRTSFLVILNQSGAIVSTIIACWVIQNGPVSLASTIFNAKPFFVFIYAMLLARLAPGFLVRDKANRRDTVMKISATLMIVGGIALIFMG